MYEKMTWATPEIRAQKRREACRKYYEKNKEKMRNYAKEYYAKHKEHLLELSRQRYLIQTYLSQDEVDAVVEAVTNEDSEEE
jgi:hypothetical protein